MQPCNKDNVKLVCGQMKNVLNLVIVKPFPAAKIEKKTP
jgi:hypothetical protein